MYVLKAAEGDCLASTASQVRNEGSGTEQQQRARLGDFTTAAATTTTTATTAATSATAPSSSATTTGRNDGRATGNG